MADNISNKNKLIGQNYSTPDLVAKVTGKAKYAEDYKAPGMLWTKLLLSRMPHARVTRLDTSVALAILTSIEAGKPMTEPLKGHV